jgi:hypothetical protein
MIDSEETGYLQALNKTCTSCSKPITKDTLACAKFIDVLCKDNPDASNKLNLGAYFA